ncbi:MAG: hypothetical protein DGJ47_000028 [Rickettsiaceae bacterium]
MLEIILTPILLGLILAPIGCFVLWKKYAYYGDGLAHASMLSIAISSVLNMHLILASIINSLLFIGLIHKSKSTSGNNASIGLVSSVMTSIALIISVLYPGNFNLEHLLFGNLFLVTKTDLWALLLILISVSGFLWFNYQKLIMTTLSRDVAHSRGINVDLIEVLFLLILSFAIIFTIKIVGALLVTSIILIPGMIARIFSRSPLAMIINSIIVIQIMNIFGVISSLYLDLPFAPAIIVSGGLLFIIMKASTNKPIKK